ncbi:uncharacterized protein LOC118645648 isoform X2 [Monomorium pharaonis]|nr:uncharacterized protein LOC118645648 isoform X2 [Monomorium pharaonis]
MAQNPNYRRPDNKEFGDAISRALKSTKERRIKYLAANANNRRRQRDLDINDADENVQPPQRRRLENAILIRDDEVSHADLENTDFTEDSIKVDDEQQSYEELYYEDYQTVDEDIAEQEQAREDDLSDCSLTSSDIAKIDEFDRKKSTARTETCE